VIGILFGGAVVVSALFWVLVTKEASDIAKMDAEIKEWAQFGRAIEGDRK